MMHHDEGNDPQASFHGLAALQSSEAMKDIFGKLVKRSQQDYLNTTEERWKVFCDKMAERLQRRFWREFQQNIEWKHPDPIIYPDNTRLFYHKGDTSLILIEQKPMVRTVRMAARLILPTADIKQTVPPFTLAFPYVVYALKFREGSFVDGHLFFMRTPLRKISDRPLMPCLSNLSPNICKICFGSNFGATPLGEPYDYNTQVENLLSFYWNAEFTTDWPENFEKARRVDPRVETPRKWSEESKRHPLFVLDVKWPVVDFDNYRHLCSAIFSDDTKVRELKKQVYDAIIEEEIRAAFREFRNDNPEAVAASKREVEAISSLFITTITDLMRSSSDVSSSRPEER
jgi:hypothetical protein